MSSSPSPSQLLELYASASSARALSYSPYSKFRVGCSFLLQDGSYIRGANVENASYGGCICAERTALLKIVTDGNGPKDRGFIALAVAADIDAPCTPCGICRQFIRGGSMRSPAGSAGAIPLIAHNPRSLVSAFRLLVATYHQSSVRRKWVVYSSLVASRCRPLICHASWPITVDAHPHGPLILRSKEPGRDKDCEELAGRAFANELWSG